MSNGTGRYIGTRTVHRDADGTRTGPDITGGIPTSSRMTLRYTKVMFREENPSGKIFVCVDPSIILEVFPMRRDAHNVRADTGRDRTRTGPDGTGRDRTPDGTGHRTGQDTGRDRTGR